MSSSLDKLVQNAKRLDQFEYITQKIANHTELVRPTWNGVYPYTIIWIHGKGFDVNPTKL